MSLRKVLPKPIVPIYHFNQPLCTKRQSFHISRSDPDIPYKVEFLITHIYPGYICVIRRWGNQGFCKLSLDLDIKRWGYPLMIN